MSTRIFFFLLGFGLTIVGCVYIISYLNLLTIGYKFAEYVNFISRRIECWNAVLGILIISFSIMIPGGKKDELYLRYFN